MRASPVTFKAETITSFYKLYFIEAILEKASDALEKKQLSKKAFVFDFEEIINKLMLSSIEKSIFIAKNNGTNFNNFNNFYIDIIFNQFISISSSNIMSDVNNFNDIDLIEQ